MRLRYVLLYDCVVHHYNHDIKKNSIDYFYRADYFETILILNEIVIFYAPKMRKFQ